MTKRMSVSVLALVMCAGAGQAWAQTTTPPASEPQVSPEASSTVESVEVTGSRLKNGDVTAKVTVITAEEIRAWASPASSN